MRLSLSKIPGYVGPNSAYTATKVAKVDGPLEVKKIINSVLQQVYTKITSPDAHPIKEVE